MACITLVAPLAMTTTELTRAIHYELAWTGQSRIHVESNSLRLSWVVVTDCDGNRRLQMQWTPAADVR
jgi:hypothetical protein